MPQLRHARHRDLQYVSDAHPIFGLRLSDGNCQANSHQAPFDATTGLMPQHIDMETIAQLKFGMAATLCTDVVTGEILPPKATRPWRHRPDNGPDRRSPTV